MSSNLDSAVRDIQKTLSEQDRRLAKIESLLEHVQSSQEQLAHAFRMQELLARQQYFEQELQKSQLSLQQAFEIQRSLNTRLPELVSLSAAMGNSLPLSTTSSVGQYGLALGAVPTANAPGSVHGSASAVPVPATAAYYPVTTAPLPTTAYPVAGSVGTVNTAAHGQVNPPSSYGAAAHGAQGYEYPAMTSAPLSPSTPNAYRGSDTSAVISVSNTANKAPRGTVVGIPAKDFQPEKDAAALQKAMKGWGVNNKKVAEVVGNRTNAQRQAIADSYLNIYNKKLYDELKSEVKFNFGSLVLRLMMTPAMFDATEIHDALSSINTEDGPLIEILCTRTPKQISDIREVYKTMYKTELGTDIEKHIKFDSKHYKNLLAELVKGARDPEGPIDLGAAKKDAAELYKAGEDKIGTDEAVFIQILTKRSYSHLAQVTEEYAKICDYDLEKSISREMSMNLKKALITILQVTRSPYEYFANRLEAQMKGLGTNDRGLIRICVSRSEIDLENIKQTYYNLFKRTLETAIKSETSGDYRELLYMIIGAESSFNPENDAKALKRAMKGIGTDNDTLINILGRRYNAQRQLIAKAFQAAYNKSLSIELEKETSGDFQKILKLMMFTPAQLDAWSIRQCIEGLGTNDDSLIEVLCTRTNQEIKAAAEVYAQVYKKPMEQEVAEDTSGDYQSLLVELCKAERDESEIVNIEAAKKDAGILWQAGEGKLGTDEKTFIEILTKRNIHQLKLIFDEYAKISDYDIEKSIVRETSFNFKKALITIVRAIRDPSTYFAERLYQSMKGAGTNDTQLIRIVLTRSEIDMPSIREAFMKSYKVSLEKFIQGDTSGNYRRMLMRIIEFSSGVIL